METNQSSKLSDTINSRNSRDGDPLILPKPSQLAENLPLDPASKEDDLASSLSERFEGEYDRAAKGPGMQNLDQADGFGAKYQISDPSGNASNTAGSAQAGEASIPKPQPMNSESFIDVQTSINTIQNLLVRIRDNLQSSEQAELEMLLKQGAQLLAGNWKQLVGTASEQIVTVKSEVKENPYRALLTALKLGMAVSQVISSRSHEIDQPTAGDLDPRRVTH